MNIVIGSRASGKTIEIIKACAESGGYIVTRNRDWAYGLIQLANKLGLNIPIPLSYDEFINGRYNSAKCKHFHIDNAEDLLAHISEIPVKTISIGIDPKTKFLDRKD